MINVKDRKCIICKKIRARYNLPDTNNPEYCGKCKKNNMEILVSTKCIICK